MFQIHYYVDDKGKAPVLNYLEALAGKSDKDSRIRYNKIRDYLKLLAERGLQTGEPYIKHLEGEMWEIRPLRNRILFAIWDDELSGFVLLHQFMKKTQKTPKREIEIARIRLHEIRGEKI